MLTVLSLGIEFKDEFIFYFMPLFCNEDESVSFLKLNYF